MGNQILKIISELKNMSEKELQIFAEVFEDKEPDLLHEFEKQILSHRKWKKDLFFKDTPRNFITAWGAKNDDI